MEQELIQDTKETLLTIADILYQGRVSDGIAAMNGVIPNGCVVTDFVSDGRRGWYVACGFDYVRVGRVIRYIVKMQGCKRV